MNRYYTSIEGRTESHAPLHVVYNSSASGLRRANFSAY